VESFPSPSFSISLFSLATRVYKIACKGDYEAWPGHVKLLSVTLTVRARCCEEDSAYGGFLETWRGERRGFLAPVELPTILRGALLVYGYLEEICTMAKKGALHIEESPGPFNTIRTSGYHHGLFDSPFYRTSRNVFFLLRLFSSALLVPSIHPSLVAARLFLPLMANRVCFWTRLNFAS